MSLRSRCIICLASTFVVRVACFIYWDEGSKLAKCFVESVDGLDTFDFYGNNRIGKAFLGGC